MGGCLVGVGCCAWEANGGLVHLGIGGGVVGVCALLVRMLCLGAWEADGGKLLLELGLG